ncbi:hypothetical protein ElyMa_001093200 [Elysia marginata]|uniref:Uncharacterized protein n=1 Tax=Elysia marginata TaxID=1093978 RepID=A0AAV4HWC9_9GAST|nr:hypothetical protein ElyMa_001093200 [Elysia marginata]
MKATKYGETDRHEEKQRPRQRDCVRVSIESQTKAIEESENQRIQLRNGCPENTIQSSSERMKPDKATVTAAALHQRPSIILETEDREFPVLAVLYNLRYPKFFIDKVLRI